MLVFAHPMSVDTSPPPPTFLIIGARKSATRWLRTHLGQYPEIFTADREIRFFNDGESFERGLEWYRSNFEGWSGEPVSGEATPGYMMWLESPAGIAARIDESLPGVRLMALLRNPVDRAYSAFVHHTREGRIPPEAGLLDHLRGTDPTKDSLGLVAGGWYAESLAPYFDRFGGRLRVFLHDETVREPERVYARALEHVGASPGFAPPGLRRVRHSGRLPEESPHAEDGGARRELRSDERAEIHEYFREDIERLEELLGRDLGVWKPPS